MIDPAQSFSNALNQGLGIMKSYRDEARLDEDRAFDKRLREKMDSRADASLLLQQKQDLRTEDEFSYRRTLRPYETAQQQEAATQAGIQTGILKTEAEYQPRILESGLETDRVNRETSLSNAATNRQNARTNARRVTLAEREYNDAQAAARQAREDMRAWGQIATGTIDWRKNTAQLAAMGPQFVRMAAMSLGVPALNEVLQNPFGSWMNDPEKVRSVMPFVGPSVRKTEEARGYTNSRIVDVDAGGRDRFKITFEGRNERTGKVERYSGFQDVDTFLGKAHGYARIFAGIGQRPQAKVSLVTAFAAGQPETFNDIVEQEVSNRETELRRLKSMGQGDSDRAMTLQTELQKIEQNDKTFVSDVVLRRMALMEQSRY